MKRSAIRELAFRLIYSLEIQKPENLEEMIRYAEKLSKAFPFVRVDLFSEDSRIIFGELTFTPTGCLAQYTDEANEMLGSWLNLKEENV